MPREIRHRLGDVSKAVGCRNPAALFFVEDEARRIAVKL
jgi:hypothetical protein